MQKQSGPQWPCAISPLKLQTRGVLRWSNWNSWEQRQESPGSSNSSGPQFECVTSEIACQVPQGSCQFWNNSFDRIGLSICYTICFKTFKVFDFLLDIFSQLGVRDCNQGSQGRTRIQMIPNIMSTGTHSPCLSRNLLAASQGIGTNVQQWFGDPEDFYHGHVMFHGSFSIRMYEHLLDIARHWLPMFEVCFFQRVPSLPWTKSNWRDKRV